MTTKYESVLSEADKVNLIRDHDDITDLVERTEQATLAKLQPQLDAIGAGGVSAREKHGFTHCIFHGDAPCGYSSWEQWINTPVKTNVFIRDATIDDWENARNSVRSAPTVSLGGQPFRKQPTEKQSAADALYQVIEKELLDIEMCFENFDTPQQAINALIDWHVSVPRITEGYKLVPIEPTPEMLSIAIKMALNAQIGFDYDWRDYTGDLWSAMLSAAPTPDTE